MQKFSFNGFGHEKTRRGEDIQKAFRYNPNSKLYVNAITKKMILFVFVLDAFIIFIPNLLLCTKIH